MIARSLLLPVRMSASKLTALMERIQQAFLIDLHPLAEIGQRCDGMGGTRDACRLGHGWKRLCCNCASLERCLESELWTMVVLAFIYACIVRIRGCKAMKPRIVTDGSGFSVSIERPSGVCLSAQARLVQQQNSSVRLLGATLALSPTAVGANAAPFRIT